MDLVDRHSRKLTCPRCEQAQPMDDFAPLGLNPRYARLLTRVYRCQLCGHLFAPLLASEQGPVRAFHTQITGRSMAAHGQTHMFA